MTHAITSSASDRHGKIDGVIRQVDGINRDMTVLTEDRHELIDVPANCSILLNGEIVKLRLLQPGDRVRVTYFDQNNVRTAQSIAAGIGQEVTPRH